MKIDIAIEQNQFGNVKNKCPHPFLNTKRRGREKTLVFLCQVKPGGKDSSLHQINNNAIQIF